MTDDTDKELPPIKNLYVPLDADILEWFKSHGEDYEAQANEVLRNFIAQQKTNDKAAR